MKVNEIETHRYSRAGTKRSGEGLNRERQAVSLTQAVRHARAIWHAIEEALRWQERSFPTNTATLLKVSFIGILSIAPLSTANAQGPDASSGLSFESIKSAMDPLTMALADVIYYVMIGWSYLMTTPPAAVLLSAIGASVVAIISIRNNRATTKLRETFAIMRAANWDDDVIKARKIFSELKDEYSKNPNEMTKYCHPLQKPNEPETEESIAKFEASTDKHEEISGVLRTIANDYENTALGIRMNIIDENFVYRSIRGNLLLDWHALSPIVTSYRAKYNNQLIYIEFEGLVNAWEQHKSYTTGRKIKRTEKKTLFS
jgi:hypothetical protein